MARPKINILWTIITHHYLILFGNLNLEYAGLLWVFFLWLFTFVVWRREVWIFCYIKYFIFHWTANKKANRFWTKVWKLWQNCYFIFLQQSSWLDLPWICMDFKRVFLTRHPKVIDELKHFTGNGEKSHLNFVHLTSNCKKYFVEVNQFFNLRVHILFPPCTITVYTISLVMI